MSEKNIQEYNAVDGAFCLINHDGRMLAKTWSRADADKILTAVEYYDNRGERDARIRAEARAEALKESAKMARSAILGFGKPQAASDRYSPMIRKDLAAQLAEHAILADEPKEAGR